jgi:hypothetical protein
MVRGTRTRGTRWSPSSLSRAKKAQLRHRRRESAIVMRKISAKMSATATARRRRRHRKRARMVDENLVKFKAILKKREWLPWYTEHMEKLLLSGPVGLNPPFWWNMLLSNRSHHHRAQWEVVMWDITVMDIHLHVPASSGQRTTGNVYSGTRCVCRRSRHGTNV